MFHLLQRCLFLCNVTKNENFYTISQIFFLKRRDVCELIKAWLMFCVCISGCLIQRFAFACVFALDGSNFLIFHVIFFIFYFSC